MRIATMAALTALCAVGACTRADNTTADTTVIPGAETTKGVSVPTTDTIVKTTTTDTIQGTARDTTKAGTKSKTGTTTKTP
jgi:hypothetical protein